MSLRIVFMGTPLYAEKSLQALLDAGHEVVGVFTQPDRPKGRGGKVQMSEVKKLALQKGIPVFQPRSIRKEGVEDLQHLAPDLCVTAAFGQILSQEVLDIPRLGTVNVHASLLPAYRGSAPINWCLIHGETTTGVTTMMTDRGIDTGDILLQTKVDILPQETAGELTLRLAEAGAALLVDTIARLKEGTCPRTVQDESQMSYHPMLAKDLGSINWQDSALQIANLVRGLNPWPTAYTPSPYGVLKILRATAEEGQPGVPGGTVLVADGKQGFLIQCGSGALRVDVLQAPGGKAMPAKDYLRGHAIEPGTRLQEQ